MLASSAKKWIFLQLCEMWGSAYEPPGFPEAAAKQRRRRKESSLGIMGPGVRPLGVALVF